MDGEKSVLILSFSWLFSTYPSKFCTFLMKILGESLYIYSLKQQETAGLCDKNKFGFITLFI